jgi:hypothetical protein
VGGGRWEAEASCLALLGVNVFEFSNRLLLVVSQVYLDRFRRSPQPSKFHPNHQRASEALHQPPATPASSPATPRRPTTCPTRPPSQPTSPACCFQQTVAHLLPAGEPLSNLVRVWAVLKDYVQYCIGTVLCARTTCQLRTRCIYLL